MSELAGLVMTRSEAWVADRLLAGEWRKGVLRLHGELLSFTDDGAATPAISSSIESAAIEFPAVMRGAGLRLSLDGDHYVVWFCDPVPNSMLREGGSVHLDGLPCVFGASQISRLWKSALAKAGSGVGLGYLGLRIDSPAAR
jgi:hypothetical protein